MNEKEIEELESIIEEHTYPTIYDNVGIEMKEIIKYVERKKKEWIKEAVKDTMKKVNQTLKKHCGITFTKV